MDIAITVDGQAADTIGTAAKRHNLSHHTMRRTLERLPVEPITPHPLNSYVPLYWASEVDEAMRNRPSVGWDRADPATRAG